MHQEGHVGLNLLLFAPIAYWLAAQGELLVMGVMMIGVIGMAPIPDIDLYLPIRHRGPTHSVWFAILAGVTYSAILLYAGTGNLSVVEMAAVGFLSGFVGVIGHMLGDMITPMGVAPLEPVRPYCVGLGLVNAGNKRVNNLFLQAGVYTLTAALVLGTVGISTLIDPFARVLS